MRLLKARKALMKLTRLVRSATGRTGQVYVDQRVDQYREMWRSAARHCQVDFSAIEQDVWLLSRGGRSTRINNDLLEFDNPVVLEMASNKPLIYRLLRADGLPVPEFEVFELGAEERFADFLKRWPQGCVVKPARGTSSGQGVTTHITELAELKRAALLASLFDSQLLVEPMIAGECYRLLVLRGEVIHAVGRRGPRLLGTGKQTVQQLIDAENLRRQASSKAPVRIDADVRFTLSYQDLSLHSVIPEGHEVLLTSVDAKGKHEEIRTVYNTVVTDQVSDDVRAAALGAARILGSEFLGVDFITRNISAPLSESGGVINEVNTTPGLHHHYDSQSETFPKVAPQILNALLGKPPSQ